MESEVPFRNILLADGQEGGLGGDKEKEKCDRSIAVSQVAGAVLMGCGQTKQEGTERVKVEKHSGSTIHSLWLLNGCAG